MFQMGCASRACYKNEILSGLTVALALVPEAVAFAFVAGVSPLVGLYAAFMVGLLASIFGGRPGMISGATGSMAVVMVALVAQHGVEYLFAAVVLTGLIQILAGILRLGKYIRIVPHPVMLGFVNGLAIVIFLAQLQHFQVELPDGTMEWMSGSAMYILLALVALTMAIMHYLPKITGAFPAALAAILVVSFMVIGFDIDTNSVGDLASIEGVFPPFHLPEVPFTLETLSIIFPYAIVLAAIGLIESLLTLSLIDDVTNTRGRGNRECVGQGIANTATGLFGGMGGCAMIGQSMININSGARGRLSGITAGFGLLAIVVVFWSLIKQIPLAALVGVMFVVVIKTFEWSTFKIVKKIPLMDLLVIIVVMTVTLMFNLAVAVLIGVVISALVFAWATAKDIVIERIDCERAEQIYHVHGPLFFGSSTAFKQGFNFKADAEQIVIDFEKSRVCDHSALDAIDFVARMYREQGKTIQLRHLSCECRQMLHDAKPYVQVDIEEDPDYRVAVEP